MPAYSLNHKVIYRQTVEGPIYISRENSRVDCDSDPPNMNQPPSFLHDIPSIHQKNPAIPAVLANLDLNRGVVAGDPLNYEEVVHAKAVVTALNGYQGESEASMNTLHPLTSS